MFNNVNPLTHRKIEKAFTPIHPPPEYALMQSHPALRPPHMFNVPPHVYAVSSERISNARSGEDPNDANNAPLDSTFQQYFVTDHMLDSSELTPEQAMEVDAARALEELAVAGRVEGWHGTLENGGGAGSGDGEGHDLRDNGEASGGKAVAPNVSPPASHSQAVPSAITPLSSTGSMDHTGNASDGVGSVESSADDKTSRGPATGGDPRRPTNSEYYRDPASRAAIPPPIIKSRKRTAGLPIPVPHLTKPSRGRRVPTALVSDMEVDSPEAEGPPSPPTSRSGTSSPYGTRRGPVKHSRSSTTSPTSGTTPGLPMKSGDNPRSYICKVEGCGKAFKRGEHLKRHVRSLHTHEKPERCTFPGCGKEFSRKDNMQQHLKIHTNPRSNTPSTKRRQSKASDKDEDDEEESEDDE